MPVAAAAPPRLVSTESASHTAAAPPRFFVPLRYTEALEGQSAQGQKTVQAAKDRLAEVAATRQRQLEEFLAQSRAEVAKIDAETKEKTTALMYEREQVRQKLRLEGESESKTLAAETSAHVKRLAAEAQLAVATNDGAAAEALAAAEKAADAHLAEARSFELQGRRLDVYEKLASNKGLVLSNSDDKNTNMMLLADNVLSSEGGGADRSNAKLMSELNMLRLAGHAYGLRSDTYVPDARAAIIGAG